MKKEKSKQEIHENYVRLTGIDNEKANINFGQSKTSNYKTHNHNDNIHDNYIKLMNGGYRTRIIKSTEELRYDDLYDVNIER